MDLDNYDEFGNYIGPELEGSDESEDEEAEMGAAAAAAAAAAGAAAGAGAGGGGSVVGGEGDLVRRGLVQMEEDEQQQQQQQKPVPHELKQYYPTAAEVYPEAETIVEEEDYQPITEPIIAPVKQYTFDLLESQLPETTFSFDYLARLMHTPHCVRNICLLGGLHTGKTSFVDMLIEETHPDRLPAGLSLLTQHIEAPHANKRHRTFFRRYTDTREDEQKRGLSIKAVPVSLLLQTSKHFRARQINPAIQATQQQQQQQDAAAAENPDAAAAADGTDKKNDAADNSSSTNSSSSSSSSKSNSSSSSESEGVVYGGSRSYLFNIIDTPGHVCFSDEASAAMRLCDGAVYFIDALEGVPASAAAQLAQVLEEGIQLIVVINKLDRIILELRLRPQDAFYKIKCMLDELNETLETLCNVRGLERVVISPRNRNLLFSMSQFSFVFSVESFAALYFDSYVFNPTAAAAAAAAANANGNAADNDDSKATGNSRNGSSSSSSSKNSSTALFGGVPLQKLLQEEALQQQQEYSSSSSRRKKQKEAEEEDLDAQQTSTPDDVYTQLELFEIALWGDFYRDPQTNKIVSSPPYPDAPRLFTEFILEPLYKLLAHCVAEERPTLEPTLAEEGEAAAAMKRADKKSDCLMVYTTKNYHRPGNFGAFDLLGRVMSGTIYKGERVRVPIHPRYNTAAATATATAAATAAAAAAAEAGGAVVNQQQEPQQKQQQHEKQQPKQQLCCTYEHTHLGR
ncbi:hypothetical protein EAH_00014200 [Eimeria acervulina]|uniref:Tr-type G domain-containing protein n=1 Tax=Eimeria acervulina TaxID=5801 RepID=U6H0C8_EIMAC|nr:hypothetical protein EAH_00014200 [Eimeria acervulina]CDI84214.1 hypothetical protein EAH_00014200 [Eimeria acervulina]